MSIILITFLLVPIRILNSSFFHTTKTDNYETHCVSVDFLQILFSLHNIQTSPSLCNFNDRSLKTKSYSRNRDIFGNLSLFLSFGILKYLEKIKNSQFSSKLYLLLISYQFGRNLGLFTNLFIKNNYHKNVIQNIKHSVNIIKHSVNMKTIFQMCLTNIWFRKTNSSITGLLKMQNLTYFATGAILIHFTMNQFPQIIETYIETYLKKNNVTIKLGNFFYFSSSLASDLNEEKLKLLNEEKLKLLIQSSNSNISELRTRIDTLDNLIRDIESRILRERLRPYLQQYISSSSLRYNNK